MIKLLFKHMIRSKLKKIIKNNLGGSNNGDKLTTEVNNTINELPDENLNIESNNQTNNDLPKLESKINSSNIIPIQINNKSTINTNANKKGFPFIIIIILVIAFLWCYLLVFY